LDHLNILPTIGLGKIKYLNSMDVFKGLVGKQYIKLLNSGKIGELQQIYWGVF